MKTSLIYDERFLNHDTGACPESAERYQVILSTLQEDKKLWDSLSIKFPEPAAVSDVVRCHSKELVKHIADFCERGGGYLDEDTVVCPESYEIALLSAGAAMMAVDEVFVGDAKNAFSLARPPGHHATRDRAMGFCLFNNAAIAARYAQAKHGVETVLIIDWDVHHGNGTQDIFYDDPSVFYFSIHEFPFYPGTGEFKEIGEGEAKGSTLNIPLPANTPADVYRKAFTAALAAIKKVFIPDLVIISAGFDARKGDPLAHLQLTEKDYFEMTHEVMDLANETCSGKLISVLEGGYLDQGNTLGKAVRQHVLGLMR